MKIFSLLLLLAPIAAVADSPSYVFDWSNTSSGCVRRVELKCSPLECLGRVFENSDVLYVAHLPVTATTGSIRRLEAQLANLPACARAKPGQTSDAALHSWRVKYFSAHTESTATAAQSTCAANQATTEFAQTFIEQVAGLAENLQSQPHGD